MSDDLIVLDEGSPADDDPSVEWRPRIALEHDAERRELYVIVGEEAAGMAEGVSAANFEAIRRRVEPPAHGALG